MAIKYLSPEWAETLTAAVNADEGFRKETAKRRCTIAWNVSDTPHGEVDYHMDIDSGTARVELGPPPAKPDLQLYCSYETLVAIMEDRLPGREAFQTKRLRSDSRLITILKYIGIFHELNRVTASIDVEV